MIKSEDSHFPIILLLDSSARDETKLALIINGTAKELFSQSRAQELPKLIEELLGREAIPYQKIRSLAVVTRGESLTGVRIGVAITNTLAWLWKIPILPIKKPGFEQAIHTLISNSRLISEKVITDIV